MNSSFSFSKYAGVVAGAAWTLGWVLVSGPAAKHLMTSGGIAVHFDFLVTIAGIAFGGLMTWRSYPRKPDVNTADPSPAEPWYKRIVGWFAVSVWCFAAVVWNLAIFGILVQAATRGQALLMAILIPFSLVGFFLLLILFASVLAVLDSLLGLDDTTPSSDPTEIVRKPPAPISAEVGGSTEPSASVPGPTNETGSECSPASSPILGTLALLVFINWFLFAGLSIYWGGDALGTLPSKDGFILTSHGQHTPVSETIWVFSLYYSCATLLVSPLIVFLFAVGQYRRRPRKGKWPLKIFITLFLIVWTVGWYSSIGSSFYRSLQDWQKLKNSTATAQPSRQPPFTTTNVNQ